MTTAVTAATTYTGSVQTTKSGSTYLTGTSSGLDTQSLIEAAVAAKTQKATHLTDQVTANTAKIAAYQGIQSLTTTLQNSLKNLTAVTSAVGTASDFDQRSVTTTTSSGTSASSYFGATVDSTANISDYSVKVIQTAKQEKVQGTNVSSNTAALGYTGSFTIGAQGSTASTINVTATTSLSDLAALINKTTATSGVSANILQTSTGSYSLILAGRDTAKTFTATAASGDDVLQNLGINDASGNFANIQQAAQQAEVNIDGANAFSDTNNFDNVLTGVSLTVYAPSTDTFSLGVQHNYSGIEADITSFVTAYNALKDAISAQNKLGADGSVANTSVLFGDNLLDSINSQIGAQLGRQFGNGSKVQSLADVGITLDVNNDLVVDSSKLESSLLDNYSDVQSLFQTQANTSSPSLHLFKNTSGVSSANISFDVSRDGSGNISSLTANGSSSLFTFSGNSIYGAKGSIYDGMTFLYSGAAGTVSVNLTAGFADTVSNVADTFSDTVTGSLAAQISSLTNTDTNLTNQAQQILTNAETYREQQIEKYSKLETSLAAANLLQQQLEAITNARDNANN